MVKYIDYHALQDEYTLSEAAAHIGISPDSLWSKCIKYGILPDLMPSGTAVLSKQKFRSIHNRIYYEYPESM